MRGATEAVVVVARRRSWLASRRLSRAPLFTAPSQASFPLPWPPPSLAIDLPELSLFWVPELSLSGGVAPAVQDLEEEVALYREILDGAQAQGTRQAPDIHSCVYEYESINWESWTRASLHLANINRSLNGIGKSTALKVLAGKLKPYLGRFKNPPDWQEILTYFRGSELQNYFTRLLEDNLKVQGIVLGVIQWGKIMQRGCK